MSAKEATLYTNKRDCCGCGACVDICGRSAIEMHMDFEGFLYPRIDRSKCINCGRCEAVCPLKCSHEAPMPETCYAAKFEAYREGSSSGGAFPALAKIILDRGGVVIGAGYTEDMTVAHYAAENWADLQKLRVSKYVQSDCRGAYRTAVDALKAGRWVLFTGTPCQSEAMRKFAGSISNQEEVSSRLLTMDIACHGVPSPGLWARYRDYLEKRYKGKLEAFVFREKRNHDRACSFSYRVGNMERILKRGDDDFGALFDHYESLRLSCYSCPFATPARNTDLTFADAWGIEKVRPDFEDGMGVSLIIPHTPIGWEMWREIQNQAECLEFPMETLRQRRLRMPPPLGKHRKAVLYLWRLMPTALYLRLMRIICNPLRLLKQLVRKAKRILKRMLRK